MQYIRPPVSLFPFFKNDALMTKEELILIKQKFKRYCDNFNLGKDGLPPMLELKYEHSCRCGARALSSDLGWPLAEQNTAEALVFCMI